MSLSDHTCHRRKKQFTSEREEGKRLLNRRVWTMNPKNMTKKQGNAIRTTIYVACCNVCEQVENIHMSYPCYVVIYDAELLIAPIRVMHLNADIACTTWQPRAAHQGRCTGQGRTMQSNNITI